jgi:hypothetical protein
MAAGGAMDLCGNNETAVMRHALIPRPAPAMM